MEGVPVVDDPRALARDEEVADRAHFAKTFARLRGVPPARFRKDFRSEE